MKMRAAPLQRKGLSVTELTLKTLKSYEYPKGLQINM